MFVFLTVSLLYNALHTSGHFFHQWRNSIVEAEEWKRQNLISQNEALVNQINPHFLFNSINTMIGLVEEHPKLAIEFGHQLADIYRQILDKGNQSLITLKEELDIVDIQCNLFKTRFGKGLKIERDIPVTFLTSLLPPLSLQHLIENAVKHNQISIEHPLILKMTVNENNIIISNNIQPKNFRSGSMATGLQNIKKRYEFLTEKEVVINKMEHSFSVKLPLLDSKLR